jgi:NADH-quinone oxidoreductase subunit J
MKVNWGKVLAWGLLAAIAVGFTGFVVVRVAAPLALSGAELVFAHVKLSDLVFYALAGMTIAGAAGVALSRNILYSALGLLMSLLGAGALYVFLSADFLAVTQLLVYIGGVLVLVLFAVMLTSQISNINISNISIGVPAGAALFVATAALLTFVAGKTPWPVRAETPMVETTHAIGHGFLTRWLLPFELASLVLLATLVGAVVIARKELKADQPGGA